MLPIIAITADTLIDHSPMINQHNADMAPSPIKEAVLAAGGVPIIFPVPSSLEDVDVMVAALGPRFDGLILPGGPDVDPTTYGQEPQPQLGRTNYLKDAFEIALVKAVLKAGKPIFAICRGLQIANVAMGGTLYQDLQGVATIKHIQAAPGNFPTHHVKCVPASRIASLVGTSSFVNSRHHQAVAQPAPGLSVTAQAQDGVIEALEGEHFLGVQWHPENLWQQDPTQFSLFTDLVARAQH